MQLARSALKDHAGEEIAKQSRVQNILKKQ